MISLSPRAIRKFWRRHAPPSLLIGQVCNISPRGYYRPDLGKFIERVGAQSNWPVGNDIVTVRAQESGDTQVLELIGQRASTSPEDIRSLIDALKNVREKLEGGALCIDLHFDMSVEKEYAYVALPRWLSASLTLGVVQLLLTNNSNRPEIKSLDRGHLHVEQGTDGLLEALHNFLNEQFRAARRSWTLFQRRPTLVPWMILAVLLATWLLPLSPLTLSLTGIATSIPVAVEVWRAKGRFRSYLRRVGTVTGLGLYSISVFGLGYGICALCDNAASPQPDAMTARLGDSFLVATSMGLAGGVVGDSLRGAALIIAHVQLLLFFGSIVALATRVLRIDEVLQNRV